MTHLLVRLWLHAAAVSGVSHDGAADGSRFSIIICLNLREFRQVIVRGHLWDPLDSISSWVAQFLFDQVGLISGLSQSHAQILSNSDK
jgi:hypothetical protein